MKTLYVYTVSLHYDQWDSSDLGIAATLPIAKRIAQADATRYELPQVAPSLKWQPKQFPHRGAIHHYWLAPRGIHGSAYHIDKVKVTTA